MTELGIFSARYASLVAWPIGSLLAGLAGEGVSLATVRKQFRQLLSDNCQS